MTEDREKRIFYCPFPPIIHPVKKNLMSDENKKEESFFDKMKETLSDLKDKAEDVWEKVEDKAEAAWDATKEKAAALKDKATDLADNLMHKDEPASPEPPAQA